MSKKETPENQKEKLGSIVAELRILEGVAGELQARIGMVEAALREINLASLTIQNLEKLNKDDELLVPVGAGSYVKTKIADTEKVAVGIGAGVTVEKTLKEAISFFENQLNELSKARASLQQQFVQVLQRMEALRNEVRKLSSI
ncbi:prefoldin subunit alpha, partial [Candidatus Bathyarchaeota archaeon]